MIILSSSAKAAFATERRGSCAIIFNTERLAMAYHPAGQCSSKQMSTTGALAPQSYTLFDTAEPGYA